MQGFCLDQFRHHSAGAELLWLSAIDAGEHGRGQIFQNLFAEVAQHEASRAFVFVWGVASRWKLARWKLALASELRARRI